ncbi:rhamnose-binding lectin-like [Perca fluviatilis]|uniref:rhamnose-binding lectin-like n=1 Tax=Perca fluviatilis TaxID=8168 RepID=UPI0019649BA8|nr:rhamnose-binding lectin-like [Perca fluviatilis]
MLCFRLSTTLLLAATCSLMTAVSTEKAITCGSDGNVQRLSCDDGVISVQTALYGRADAVTCSEGRPPAQLSNTHCSQAGTVDVVKKRCDGKRECELNINVFYTSDPCYGTYKYLETTYTCIPAIHLDACEGSLAQLQCDQGQVIFVYGADYGRRDQTTCIYQRPPNQVQIIYCSRPTRKVADSCNGKNSCTIAASNSVFGDPCVGTYKYLEVAYICYSIRQRQFLIQQNCSLLTGSFKTMLRLRLSTTLLLAATCSLMTAGKLSEVSLERAITCGCEGNVQRLSCDAGVITVLTALYGRADAVTCSEGIPPSLLANTQCSQVGTVDVVKKGCDGKNECKLNINVFFTSDPCYGIFKYLDTTYTCFPTFHLVACEGSLAQLQCDQGQVIFVYNANYGRLDQTTCIYQRPPEELQNIQCLSPAPEVADSCNGENSCTIAASNFVFGDPCYGTYKYLEVVYICEYPGTTPLP